MFKIKRSIRDSIKTKRRFSKKKWITSTEEIIFWNYSRILEPACDTSARFQGIVMQNKRNFARRTLPVPKLKIQHADEESSLFDNKSSEINDHFLNDSRYKLRNIITTEKNSEEKET